MFKDGSGNLLGPNLILEIDCVLNQFEENKRQEEEKQITFAILRNISGLRRIYGFYSSLGHSKSPGNALVLTKLQFWRFLKDCHLHNHNISLSAIDRIISKSPSSEEIHNPMEKIIFRKFLSYCVMLSFNIYRKEQKSDDTKPGVAARCLQQLLDDHVLKLSGKVGGHFLGEPRRAINALTYMETSWNIYREVLTERRQPPYESSFCMRQFLFLLKDLKIIGPQLITRDVLKILASDDPSVFDGKNCNLELEMTFLEFFEALIGIALNFSSSAEESHQLLLRRKRLSLSKTEEKPEISEKTEEKCEPEVSENSNVLKTLAEEEFTIWCSKLRKFFTLVFFPAWHQVQTLRHEVEKNKVDKERSQTTNLDTKTLE